MEQITDHLFKLMKHYVLFIFVFSYLGQIRAFGTVRLLRSSRQAELMTSSPRPYTGGWLLLASESDSSMFLPNGEKKEEKKRGYRPLVNGSSTSEDITLPKGVCCSKIPTPPRRAQAHRSMK